MKAGRPIEYTDDIVEKAKQYLDECVDEIEEYHKTRGEKSDSYDRLVRGKLPTIEGLAVYLDIARDTIYEWEKSKDENGKKKYPAFSDILSKLREKQADALINNGLSGDYNPVISKLLLAKHGYVDKQEITGADGKDLIPDKVSQDKAEKALEQYLAK